MSRSDPTMSRLPAHLRRFASICAADPEPFSHGNSVLDSLVLQRHHLIRTTANVALYSEMLAVVLRAVVRYLRVHCCGASRDQKSIAPATPSAKCLFEFVTPLLAFFSFSASQGSSSHASLPSASVLRICRFLTLNRSSSFRSSHGVACRLMADPARSS